MSKIGEKIIRDMRDTLQETRKELPRLGEIPWSSDSPRWKVTLDGDMRQRLVPNCGIDTTVTLEMTIRANHPDEAVTVAEGFANNLTWDDHFAGSKRRKWKATKCERRNDEHRHSNSNPHQTG